ncbi:uncharacterized protein LOC142893540 isoform X2 [Nelusetta ayraudi]|uniref:uncharacterized protein LOC142893540 isoform X2 n=1 Tax=Nelusetta ayraudi TaxID=303726 RepID=UPI003F714E36
MSLSTTLLVLLLAYSTNASHFYGTVMTYHPKQSSAKGSTITVVLRYKLGFRSCSDSDTWGCFSGNCGNERSLVVKTISEKKGEWCHSEGIMTRLVPSNGLFQLRIQGRNWLENQNGVTAWRAVTLVELRNRSDTNHANRSPQTTILPALRVPSNCLRNIQLLAFDPDGDEVKCRYGESRFSECRSCNKPSVLSLSSSCRLQFNPTDASGVAFAVQLVMEDFPRQTINLTETNGKLVTKTPKDALSKIPIQFALKVDPKVTSCIEGIYLPLFVHPTPTNGALLKVFVNHTLTIIIHAVAISSRINNQLLLSSPSNVIQNSTVEGQFVLSWMPNDDQGEETHAICFVVHASSSDK